LKNGTISATYKIPESLIGNRILTGLHDKDGKEIYEGDVVRHRKIRVEDGDIELFLLQSYIEQNRPIKVEWQHCSFFPFAGWIDDANKNLEWEVIGNIYENPELLRETASEKR
jgi:uncharacterized phage protein (TIGR01671 family)